MILHVGGPAPLVERPGADGRPGQLRHSWRRSAGRPPRLWASSGSTSSGSASPGWNTSLTSTSRFPRNLPCTRAIKISHIVKDQLLDRFTNLRDVLVHLEPFPHDHEEIRASESDDRFPLRS